MQRTIQKKNFWIISAHKYDLILKNYCCMAVPEDVIHDNNSGMRYPVREPSKSCRLVLWVPKNLCTKLESRPTPKSYNSASKLVTILAQNLQFQLEFPSKMMVLSQDSDQFRGWIVTFRFQMTFKLGTVVVYDLRRVCTIFFVKQRNYFEKNNNNSKNVSLQNQYRWILHACEKMDL